MRWTLLAIAVGGLLAPLVGEAQPRAVPRIGVLSADPISARAQSLEAFRQGLRELGYVEGQTLTLEVHSAEGKRDRLSALASRLVARNVDVIVTSTTPAVQAARQSTGTIPIVAITADPVATGLVASLARPGGNITGLSIIGPELSGKQLELVAEALPKVKRVGLVWDPANPALALRFKEVERAARALGLQVESLEVRTAAELESAFEPSTVNRVGALIVPPPIAIAYQRRLLELAARHRLPVMYEDRESVTRGGLMSYGANLADLWGRAATYVDRILKGAKPADLPVEQATKFELVINLKTAKALGLVIPASLLVRADQVID